MVKYTTDETEKNRLIAACTQFEKVLTLVNEITKQMEEREKIRELLDRIETPVVSILLLFFCKKNVNSPFRTYRSKIHPFCIKEHVHLFQIPL